MKFSATILAALSIAGASFNLASAQESVTLQLEDLDAVDLSVLGTANVDKYNVAWDLTVSGGAPCEYTFTVSFEHPDGQPQGANSFTGGCAPNVNSVASDGLRLHDKRTNWLQLPEFVERSTGMNHMDISWVPCGKAPKGYRQPRYDVNFYYVSPQYRTFMECDTFETPTKCQYDQTGSRGRQHFVLPVRHGNKAIIANMPTNFQPDPNEPAAFEYEGLICGTQIDKNPNDANDLGIPVQPEDWTLPGFQMAAFDGDITSWRAMIPYTLMAGPGDTFFVGSQQYEYMTERRLPLEWQTSYIVAENTYTIILKGNSGICDTTFATAKQEWQDEQSRARP
jgi:hypothetical protein